MHYRVYIKITDIVQTTLREMICDTKYVDKNTWTLLTFFIDAFIERENADDERDYFLR